MPRHEDIPSVMCSTRKYVRPTPCRYSVIFGCPDPPTPALYFNTNDKAHARRAFERLKANEQKNSGGGEFTLTFYDHGATGFKPAMTYYKIKAEDDERYGVGYVYSIIYHDSEEIDSFSYMDLIRDGANAPA